MPDGNDRQRCVACGGSLVAQKRRRGPVKRFCSSGLPAAAGRLRREQGLPESVPRTTVGGRRRLGDRLRVAAVAGGHDQVLELADWIEPTATDELREQLASEELIPLVVDAAAGADHEAAEAKRTGDLRSQHEWERARDELLAEARGLAGVEARSATVDGGRRKS